MTFPVRYTVHTISFGNGADDEMLKQIARDNNGRWKKILSDLDAALQVLRRRLGRISLCVGELS